MFGMDEPLAKPPGPVPSQPPSGRASEAPVPAAGSIPALEDLSAGVALLWRECAGLSPSLSPPRFPGRRSSREKALAAFVDGLRAEAGRPPRDPAEARQTRDRILSGFRGLAREAWGWEDRHLDILFSNGFDRSALGFTRDARAFDPGLAPSDIYQAWRNVWVMNGLQVLLGLPVRLTPSVFAYSLLYPYTDNYLDDPGLAEETKRAFNARLELRLGGGDAKPLNAREEAVFSLVGRIEGQFDRARHPQVYESLLAIHRTQVESVRLLKSVGGGDRVDAAAISLAKGGASVLADGCLAAGSLTGAQAEFLFRLGAFLQLVDDAQDVEGDVRDGLRTVFSEEAGRRPLDSATDRVLCFGLRVMEGLKAFGRPGSEPLQELIHSSTLQAVVGAVGSARRFYSRTYVRALEVRSPVRFAFSRRQSRKLSRRREMLERLFGAVLTLSDESEGGRIFLCQPDSPRREL
jgi:hypothetical protein